MCASCGFDNSFGLKFCGECGTRLQSAASVGGRERKTVSVLFCDLVGFTAASDGADPEEVQAALSPYHARARIEIERFGGTVEKFIGDAVMAAFGAPVVHEDDPERAVRAGLALLAAVDDLNTAHNLDLAIRVGIATGEAVVSTGARPERGEGMLAGDVVNTAARLQTSAPVGGVLVGESTRDATQVGIEYAPHDPIMVKGKSDPLPVWVAVRARGFVGEALTETSRPMVGREDELLMLQRAFTRAVRESSVQLVTVVAEPGLGKSRLVQAFSDWVDGREELVTWRQGRCPSYGDAVTYVALGQVVKAQTGILDTDTAAVSIDKLSDTVHALVNGTDLTTQESWLVARLAPLVGLPATETPQEELFTAWRRFLETLAATNPLVLVVEDLHWADPAMLDFLTHLLEWVVGVPLVIIATTRPELYDTTPGWGSGHRNSNTLTLSPLSDVENAQLVTSLLGAAVLPADLHAALLVKSAGNPLYTREYLNMLTDQTRLAAPGSGTVAQLTGTLPGSVQAVIAARLDTLPAEHKQLLQAAAVVGHTFWAGAIAALTHIDQADESARLHDLVRRDYLRPSRSSSVAGQPEYTFNHALIADVAYYQLPRQTRATHHHRAGDWHASLTGRDGSSGGQAGVIAHHYTQAHILTSAAAGDPAVIAELATMAADWHVRAAGEALQFDLAAAEAHCRAALDLSPAGHPAHPKLLMLLGRILDIAGRSGDADTAYQQAHAEATDAGNPVAAAQADARRSVVLTNLARLSEGTALVQRAVKTLEAYPPGEELLEAYLASAQNLVMRGLTQPSIDRANQALDVAVHLDDPPPRLLAAALSLRGSRRAWSGDSVAGEQDMLRALDIARTHNLTDAMMMIDANLGLRKFLTQSASEAIPHLERAVDLAIQRGRTPSLLSQSANLANALTIAGRIDDALAVCERASAALAETDSPRDVHYLQENLTGVLLIRGELDRAAALIAQALPVARGLGPDEMIPMLLHALTCATVSYSEAPVADLLDELVSVLQDPDLDGGNAEILPQLARVLCPAGHHDLVTRILAHVPPGVPLFENNALTAQAVLAEAAGDSRQALDLYTRATTAWAAYGYPLEQAHALLGAARCCLSLNLPARRLVLDGRDLLTQLGAAPLLAETARLLDVCKKGQDQGRCSTGSGSDP
jgi:class 3 adenylate cyclase/tetratricopeptide (TPR) repeat protein